ncbi:EpsG family protein [Enterococcus dongliensis]|uniref:EpsG family protein n=1 Tax=Enterococcus dongliensis TaxID=2559925 RepID=UPI00288DBF3E|nr:EpsG family protein [Enterococcus dongliensis]MDT2703452.1 EpsG family protein [Enterococcus dongliensis]
MNREASVLLYLISFIFSSIMIYLGVRKQKKTRVLFTFFGISIPVILATFRSLLVGTDTQPYYYLYSYYGTFSNLSDKFRILGFKEFLNTILIHVCSTIGNFNMYLFIFAFFTFLLVIIALYQLVPVEDIPMGYFIYLCFFFPQTVNIMRQSLAVAIVFLGYQFIIKRKLLKYLLIVFIATGIHISAFLALPLYFLINKKKEINRLVATIISCALVFFIIRPSWIFTMLSSISGFERYSFYNDFTVDTNNRLFFINLIILSIIYVLKKYLIEIKNENKFFILLLFFGLLVGMTGFTSPFIKRISIYFDILQIVLIAEITNLFSDRFQNLIVKYGVYVIGCIYFIVAYYYLSLAGVVPYSFQIY